MPKDECSTVFGHAPRKALGVKKAIKKGSDKATAKQGAGKAKPPKKAAPAAIEVVSADEHVSASPTPPTPSSPHSPTYVRESWWDSFGDLSRRINDATASIKDLKDRVKVLEDEREKNRSGCSVFGKGD